MDQHDLHDHHNQHDHHDHNEVNIVTTTETLSIPTTNSTRPRITRVFQNILGPGTTAVVESALKISIPIPFCQFENAPCKIFE